jgi:hypothetical protein
LSNIVSDIGYFEVIGVGMVTIKRLSHVSYSKLKMIATFYNKNHEPHLCFIPLCKYCKTWLLNQIAIYQGFGSRRFICVNCYISKYGKRAFRQLYIKHLSKISKTDNTSRSLIAKYLELLSSHG